MELHHCLQPFSGIGQESGRSSAVTSYWLWAFGWISGRVVVAAIRAGLELRGAHYK
jgi:hypothetical protein